MQGRVEHTQVGQQEGKENDERYRTPADPKVSADSISCECVEEVCQRQSGVPADERRTLSTQPPAVVAPSYASTWGGCRKLEDSDLDTYEII